MRLNIRHHTAYRYEEPVSYSVQSLRLWPSTHDAQRVVKWRLEVPGIEAAASFVDGFGNRVHLVTVETLHEAIEIDVWGEVETDDASGLVTGLKEAAPRTLFLRRTAMTTPDDAIEQLARSASGGDQVKQLHELMRLIRERVDYRKGTTDSNTTAAEALASGAGVCQDHTHIFIAAARVLGVPTRYVSGYLLASEESPLQAQHAWAEAHVEALGWVGFDVSNGICTDSHYVRVACGLDYEGAAPVRGSRRGGAGEKLDVHVEVGQIHEQAQQ